MQPKFLKAMAVIHFALIVGVSSFLAVAFALVQINGTGLMAGVTDDLTLIFYGMVYGIGLLCVMFGTLIFERNMTSAKSYGFIKEKIEIFKSAYIIRLALTEGPCFLSIIIFMLTGNYYFLPATGLCILVLFLSRPTIDFIAEKLYLTQHEKEELQDA